MKTYERNGKVSAEQLSSSTPTEEQEPGGMRVNGFQQVLELLAAADPAFRESLLQRIARRDVNLAASLRRALSQ